jgi:hypothetical protein
MRPVVFPSGGRELAGIGEMEYMDVKSGGTSCALMLENCA